MRTPIIAGNWKMNKSVEESRELAEVIAQATAQAKGVEVVVGPTTLALAAVIDALAGTHVKVAAQNMHAATSGAYTGEVSASMLKEAGCHHVILGHSERRQLFGETDRGVNEKIKVALAHGLVPIVCVGESLEEREAQQTVDKVSFQVTAALSGIGEEQVSALVIAYEPIWAIGTGKTASPEQAQEVHAAIRALLTTLYGESAAQEVRIQYGGSVKPGNIAELIAQPDIDGALVGGASLRADGFAQIVSAAGS